MKTTSIAATLTTLATFPNPTFANISSPTVTIDAGVVVGTTTSLHAASTVVNRFLGIPYAAPPTRFTPPQEPEQWDEPLDAKEYKPACIQQFQYPKAYHDLIQGAFNTPAPEESEDCLYLNVYAPASPVPPQGRAVLYWIYGGALQFGHAGHPSYDASHFAAFEDVVVVSANYRTNVFGFPSSSELPLEAHNLGFLDQRFSLDWVQRNIHVFGGDPSKVTVFGESAGAFSIDALLTSFPANSTPPFRAAILQSGQISYRGNPAPGQPYPDSTASWYGLAAALNCTEDEEESNLTCISKAPAATVKDIIEHQALPFWPTYDNVTLVANPAQRRTSGDIAKVPMLGGTNAQEGRALVIGQTNITAYLGNIMGVGNDTNLKKKIEQEYPVGGWEFPTEYDAIAQIETDLSFQCAQAYVSNDSAAVGVPSWRYYFNASFPNTQQFPNGGVYHSSEIGLVFSTYPRVNATVQESTLSNYMRGAWAHFAKDPIAGPGWNAVGTGSEFLDGTNDLSLGVIGGDGGSGIKVIKQSVVDGRCALWEPILKKGN